MRRVESKSPCSSLYGHHSVFIGCTVFVRLKSGKKADGPPLHVFWETQLLEAGRRLVAGWKGDRRGVDEVRS